MANETDDWGKDDQPVTSDWGAGDLPNLPSKKYLPSTVSGALSEATKPITSIPAAYQEMIRSSVGQMGRGVEQLSGALEQPTISSKAWEAAKGVGNIALGGVGYVGAPLAAPLHTIVGEPVTENLEPVIGPQAAQVAGAMAEGLAGFALPTKVPQLRAAPKMPLEEPYGITRSLGERTGNIGMRAEEAGAMRTAKDPYAVEFAAQREAQIDAARENLIRGMDPYEQQIIALTPREAGELVSRGVIGEATAARTNVNSLYRNARELPGEINAGAFKGTGQKIKGDVSLGDNPVIIDNTTPQAAKMINYLDDQISNLKIKNVADPFGAPSAENIVGVNLNGVDQWRKNLSLMRRDAFASSPPGQINADARAAQAVLDAFDEKVINAINNPAIFTGNARAVDAWNQARQAYSDYKRTFTAQRNDPAGRAVQRIIGDPINDPLTPSKVIDSIVGPTGVTSTPTNIAVANRVRSVLGEYSPEWIGVKQGLLQRLIRPAEGEADFGIAKQAQNLSKFLNNDMARVVYTPAEQNVLRGYANLMRDLTLPPGTYAPSEPAIRRLQSALTQRVGGVIGSIIGSKVVPIPVLGEAVGYSVGKQIEKTIESSTNNLKKNFPIISQEMRKWSEAQSRAMAQPQNTMAQRAAVSAFVGLQNALTPLGIKLDELMQPRTIPQITIHKEPPRATGGSVFDKMHMARKRAEGGGTDVPFNEWDAVPRNAEGIPQIRIEKPPVNEADEAQAAREAAAARVAGNVRGAPYEPTPPSTEGKTWLMEPGKEAVQSGNYENTLPPNVRLNDAGIPYNVETGEELQMARRPSVLPLTRTPDGVQWAMPKAVELAGDIVNPLAVTKGVALNPGEFALGSGPIKRTVLEQPNAPTFYSALDRAVTDIPQTKASAEQWAATLANRPGVKPEEIQWRGLDQYLAGRAGQTVTKQEIADHLAGNKVELGSVVKGEFNNSNLDAAAIRARETGDWAEYDRLLNQAKSNETSNTKYHSYQLPGGENYSEKLLTLPQKADRRTPLETARDMFGPDVKTIYDLNPEQTSQLQSAIDKQVKQGEGQFRSPHWDEPNPVTHMRTNERTIGNTASHHIEEVQSDWHQKGRAKGYNSPEVRQQAQAKADAAMQRIVEINAETEKLAKDRNPVTNQMVEEKRWFQLANERDAARREMDAAAKAIEGGVPDAPFKKTWPDLTMKQALRDAVENGKDRLSWTPGKAQAARYDLSQHVKEIEYVKNSDGTYRVGIADKDGEPIWSLPGIDVNRMTMAQIEATFGKEIAVKIENGSGRRYRGHDGHTLEGLDLKVGGEVMNEFYNKMLPKAVEKLGKAHGVKVQRGVDTTGNPVNYVDIPPAWKQEILKKGFPLFASGGSVFDKMHMARKRAEGGGTDVPFNEWDAVRQLPEGSYTYPKTIPTEETAFDSDPFAIAAARMRRSVVHDKPLTEYQAPTNKPYIVEPDLVEAQQGHLPTLPDGYAYNDANIPFNLKTGKEDLPVVRRSNVLPIAMTPNGPRWGMSKMLDVASNIMGGVAGAPAKAGQVVLGSGPVRKAGTKLTPVEGNPFNQPWDVKGFEGADWFHGTTHEFDKFKLAKGNPENYLGQYPHFTTAPEDAAVNYAGKGPDLTARIENRAEQIFDKVRDKYPNGEVGDDYGKVMTAAKNQATKELAGPHEGAIIPAKMKMQNPASLIDSKPTWIDFNPKWDKAGEEVIAESKNITKLLNSLKKQGEKYGFDGQKVFEEVAEKAYLYDGDVKASDLDKALRESNHMLDAANNKGNFVSSHVISNVFKDLGFDGIVMDAKSAFPHMKNIPEGTLHAVPLKQNMVKGKYNDKILYSDTRNQVYAAAGHELEKPKPFYSTLERAVDGAPVKAGEVLLGSGAVRKAGGSVFDKMKRASK